MFERSFFMGRDNKQGSTNNSRSLPQTPKRQKIQPGDMKEEMAREFEELSNFKPKRERMIPNERKRK